MSPTTGRRRETVASSPASPAVRTRARTRPGLAKGPVRAAEMVDERAAEPAGGARDDRRVRRVEAASARPLGRLDEPAGVAHGHGHHRALRVDAGRVGQQRGVVDPDVVVPRTSPKLSAAERGPSPKGTVEHRCTVITLARATREACACIAARSARPRTTGRRGTRGTRRSPRPRASPVPAARAPDRAGRGRVASGGT